jgi:hypothetical protein
MLHLALGGARLVDNGRELAADEGGVGAGQEGAGRVDGRLAVGADGRVTVEIALFHGGAVEGRRTWEAWRTRRRGNGSGVGGRSGETGRKRRE